MTVLPSPIPHPLDFCPWDLPGWAYEALEWVVGFQWPDGDEKETWDAADRWFALAGVLAGPRDEATEAAYQVISGYGGGGVTVAAFQQAWHNLAEADAPLNSLMEISHELGKMIEECGSDIEGAKLEAWIELGIFVIELIGMAVAVALTLGAASPAAAGLIAATRFAIQQIFRKLLEQLGKKAIKKSLKEAGERATKQLTTKAGLKHLGKDALREGLDEAAEEAATNGAIQVYQGSTGRGDGLDVRELGMSGLGGFAGGFAASGAQVGRGGRNSVGDALRGAGGEVLGEFGGAAVFGDLPDLEGVAKSASSGVTGSAVHSVKADLGDALSDLDTSGLTAPVLPPATPVSDAPGSAGPAPAGQASASGDPAPAVGERLSAAAPVLAGGVAIPDSSAAAPVPPGHSIVETSATAPGPASTPGPSTEPSPSGTPGPIAESGSSPSGPTIAAGPSGVMSLPGSAPGPSAGHGSLPGADSNAGLSPETSFAGRPGGLEPGLPGGGPGGGLRTDPPGLPRDSSPAVPGKETALAKAPGLESPRPIDRIAEALAPRPARADRLGDASAPPVKAAATTHPDLQRRPETFDLLASPPPHPAPARHFDRTASARAAYFGYLRHARQTHEDLRREELVTHLVSTADLRHSQAVELSEQAGNALRDGLTLRADRWFAGSRELRAEAAYLEQTAGQVRSGEIVPARVDVEGADWARINYDVGDLAVGPVETDDTSRLTGDDHPPAIDRGRRYGIPGGLRAPLAVHQTDLERAMPRDDNGRVQRMADPRQGDWFGLANDGGPEADPTRGINCLDGVLSLFDTYVHGRPRVSAPRTFDSYANGDPTRPLGAENGGLARIEETVQGQFQGLCPYVGATDHARARQSVDLAMANLSNHLHNLGHGAFAFIVTDSEGGSAHAWTAVNHDGTILFLDPQTRRISETVPLYANRGAPSEANVVSMDALVVDSAGQYSPLPFHRAGIWSQSAAEPTGAEVPIAESDRYDPPGVGYFADLYERFDAANVERGYFDSLPPDQQEVIEQSVLAAEAIADRAQRDLLNAIDSLSGFDGDSRPRVVGTEHRTKTSASLARAYTLREDSQSDLETFLDKQKDRVRFSVEVPLEKYETAVVATLESLKSRGYEAGRIVNFWNHNGRHNGLNITVTDSTGSIMEVQFPTRLTGVIGKETHRYYETLRLPDFPTQLRVDAFLRMLAINKRHDLAAQRPPGLSELGSSTPVDTCLARWLTKEEITRDEYEEWLQEHGLTWSEMLERHRLSVEDTYGPSWSEQDR